MKEYSPGFLTQADLHAIILLVKVFSWKANGFRNTDEIFFNDSY